MSLFENIELEEKKMRKYYIRLLCNNEREPQ